MKISLNGKEVGKIEIELFRRVPMTSYNFKCLCTGEKGGHLHYKNNTFHRVRKGYFI